MSDARARLPGSGCGAARTWEGMTIDVLLPAHGAAQFELPAQPLRLAIVRPVHRMLPLFLKTSAEVPSFLPGVSVQEPTLRMRPWATGLATDQDQV
jgi:hypothetical protein